MNKRREQSGTISNEMRAQQREASEKVQEISKELRELKSKIQASARCLGSLHMMCMLWNTDGLFK